MVHDRRRPAGSALRALACALGCSLASAAPEPPYRFAAPLVVDAPAPFLELRLPAEALRHSQRVDLADLRIVDAEGRRTPFAWLATEPAPPPPPVWREATLYPLPARGERSDGLPAWLEVRASGTSLLIHPSGDRRPSPAQVPGWLADLGDAPTTAPRPDALKLDWPAQAPFSAGYRLETSDDLRAWRPAGSGSVMALDGSGGGLAQPLMPLPPGVSRFVRWYWDDPRGAPQPASASVRIPASDAATAETTTRLVFALSAEPAAAAAAGDDPAHAPALVADLGGVLPIAGIHLDLGQGTQVLPVRLQWRQQAQAPWSDAASAVFYRIERDGGVRSPPPLALHGRARYLRLVPDARSTPPDPSRLTLSVDVVLPRLVWAQQGTPPHRLLVGSADAVPGALPLATLVPAADTERPRFGRSSLGRFDESGEVAAADERNAWLARWRPRLLWALLVAGVAVLGAMAWRLARSGPQRPEP